MREKLKRRLDFFRRFLLELLRLYTTKPINRSSAALCYFLVMTFFPLIILLYTMLGSSYALAMRGIRMLEGFVAEGTLKTITDFVRYVAMNVNQSMTVAAGVVLVGSASAGVRTLQSGIGELQGHQRYQGVFDLGFSILFSVILVIAIYASAVILVTGRQVIDFVNAHIPFVDISVSWDSLRFLVLALIIYLLLLGVYKFSRPVGERYHTHVGAIFSTIAIVAVSYVFSAIIGNSARYPLVYGSLASMILLMMWMYTSCIVIFLGAAVNIALRNVKRELRERRNREKKSGEASGRAQQPCKK